MDDRRDYRLSEYLWQIIVLLIGIIAIIISFIVKDTGKVFSTINGIGVSLLLSGILGVFMNILFSRKDAKYKVCEEWKIKNIYFSRTIANITVDSYQQSAKKNVDIIAFGLSSWRQSKESLIDNMLSNGVKIRIITMNPDNPILTMRDQAEGKPEGYTKKSIMELRTFFKKTSIRKKVKIKYHNDLPLDLYFRVDNHVFVGPYLFGKDSQQMITCEFEKGGKGFDYYTNYFDSLWNGTSAPELNYADIDSV